MNGSSKSWRKRPEHAHAEAYWRETGEDVRYAALAIGQWYTRTGWPLSSPPYWALEACAKLYEKSLVQIEPVVRPTQGGRPYGFEYALIDRVARTRHLEKGTTSTIFRRILRDEMGLKDDELRNTVKRIRGYWGKETIGKDGVVCNDHINRVAKQDAISKGYGRSFEDWDESDPVPRHRRKRDAED